MTNTPNPGNSNENRPQRRLWLLLLSRGSVAFLLILLVAVVGGAIYGWIFVHSQLAPLIEKNLSQLLNRPVKMGAVERFTLTSLRFGPTSLPATPTDPDRATVQAVEVKFEPLRLILTRTLKLDITLVEPDLYVEQSTDGVWLDTRIEAEESEGPLKTELDVIRLRGGQAVVVPSPAIAAKLYGFGNPKVKKPITLQKLQGNADFRDGTERVIYEVAGQIVQGGNVTLKGESILKTLQTKLAIQGRKIQAPIVSQFVPALPVELQAGAIDANLVIQLRQTEVLSWQGNARFQNVTARLANVPPLLSKANGRLRFNGLSVGFENVSSLYGLVPVNVEGVIDTAGEGQYDLALNIPSVTVAQFLETQDFETQIPLEGEFEAELEVVGKLREPIIQGTIATTKTTLIDQINFSQITAGIQIGNQNFNLTSLNAQPVSGGVITGNGKIQLAPKQTLALNFQANNLAGDALAKLYNVELPVVIGSVNADVSVTGDAETPLTLVSWQAPQATFAGRGELAIDNELIRWRDTVFQVGGGTVSANGQYDIAAGRWQTAVLANSVMPNQVTGLAALPDSEVNGQVQLSGLTNVPDPVQAIAANGQFVVDVSGAGAINATTQLNNGQWQLTARTSPFDLQQFGAPVPIQLAASQLNVSGTVDSFAQEDIRATAQARLNLAGGSVDAIASLANNQLQLSANLDQLNLNQLAPTLPQPVAISSGQLDLSANLETLIQASQAGGNYNTLLAQLDATLDSEFNIAGGVIDANAAISNGQWRLNAIANGVDIARFAPNVPEQVQLTAARVNLAGNLQPLLQIQQTPANAVPLFLASARGDVATQLDVNGGGVDATVTLGDNRWQLDAIASNFPLSQFTPNLQQSVELVSAQANIFGSTESLIQLTQTPEIPLALNSIQGQATAQLNIDDGRLNATARLGDNRWGLQATASSISLNQFAPELLQPVGIASAEADFTGDLSALINVIQQPDIPVFLATVRGNGRAEIDIANGILDARANLNQGNWNVDAIASGLDLNRFANNIPDSVRLASAQISASGSGLNAFDLAAITANAELDFAVAGGTLSADGTLNRGQWNLDAIASGINLNVLAPNLLEPVQLTSGRLNAAGNLDAIALADIQANTNLSLEVAGGNLDASAQINQGNYQISAIAAGLQLSQFSPQIPPDPVNGQLNLAGSLASLNPATITVDGNVQLGQQYLSADGVVVANLVSPSLQSFDLEIVARTNLDTFPVAIPNNVALAGNVNFAGRVSGTPTTPSINGNLELLNFAIEDVAFDPILTGPIQYTLGSGGSVDLNAVQGRDRIAATLAANNFPTFFDIRANLKGGMDEQTIATGTWQNDRLDATFQNFPLSVLNLSPAAQFNLGPIAGRLSAEIQATNLSQTGTPLTPQTRAIANIQITDPALGRIQANRFIGQVIYNDGVVVLQGGELAKGESLYQLDARVARIFSDNPLYQAKLVIARGQLQDILSALQIYTIQDATRGLLQPADYATAEAVETIPAGLPNAPLIAQLRRFAEIIALIKATASESTVAALPEQLDFRGQFGGTIEVQGSVQGGPEASFDIAGENWEWRPNPSYQTIENGRVVVLDPRVIPIDRFILKGGFENGVITLLPLRIESEETLIGFTGRIGGENQSGQLRIAQLPIETIRNFVELPAGFEIDGNLNARATLAGSISNPQARGEVTLTEATLNFKPVETAQTSFSYSDGRLNFGGRILVAGPDPIQINGSIPVAFGDAQPASDEINIQANVQNEGLAIINALTDQVQWVEGQGSVQLQVTGTLAQPIPSGIAKIENATLQAQTLPDPLTNVTGRARFEGDRIIVENISGDYGEGKVVAAGVLPLFAPISSADPDNPPLTVALDQLDISLKGLYRGEVEGRILVTGTAFNPVIGGNILLSDGQVLLPEQAPAAEGGGGGPADATPVEETGVIEFNDLLITLGDDIRITSAPLLSFVAAGDLTLNGPLDDMRPSGTIELKRGQVNLFTTQFTLARGYEQTAVFVPSRGLDPILSVRLVSSVPEVTRTPILETASSEVLAEDTPASFFGAARTVRIEAIANGPASELSENLVLTSSPERTRSEIIALLGGTFVNTLGQGDTTLALANLAGSALLSNVQTFLTNFTGLDFRLFPTFVSNKKGSSESTILGLGAEVGLDISRNFSFSALQVLGSNQPTRFSIRYRLNDEVILRGSSDFSGDSRATIEYETQF